MIRYFVETVVGDIGDENAETCRFIDWDVIDAGAELTDDPALWRDGQRRHRNLPPIDEHRVRVFRPRDQLVVGAGLRSDQGCTGNRCDYSLLNVELRPV